jgi:hypothetical protein
MKRIKIMLLSLALFAVVGGALAFKAKFTKTFCTTNAILNAGVYTCIDPANNKVLTCPTKVVLSTTDPTPGATPAFCTTTVNALGQCPGVDCAQIPTSVIVNH